MEKKIVLIQGAFDIINRGHIKAFEYCKTLGTHVIVALNSNELIKEYKKRDAVLPWEQKAFIIKSCRFVDEVVQADNFSPMELLKEHNVDVYVLTQEWENTKEQEIKYMKDKGGEVVLSPRFEGVVCTSDIKKTLLKEAQDGLIYSSPNSV